jgi:hypothetical protein
MAIRNRILKRERKAGYGSYWLSDLLEPLRSLSKVSVSRR